MKSKILQAAANNIGLYGLRKFTMDSICNDLKISKKTIYKYFDGKDDIISEYFSQCISMDKESTLKSLKADTSLDEKIKNIIYSYHKYKIPVEILHESKLYYPGHWKALNDLKEFKINAVICLLTEAKENGELKDNVDIKIVSLIIDSIGDNFLNSDVLVKNNLKLNHATNEILQIILNGIVR